MRNINRLILAGFAFVLFFLPAASALAAGPTLTEIKPLDFGKFGMHDNKSVHTIVLLPDNSVVSDPAFVFGRPPQRGEYLMEGLPDHDSLTVTFSNSVQVLPQGTLSPQFTIDHYTSNSPITTDGQGRATLYIGATLRTSGAGPYYKTDAYSGSYDVTIVY